MVYVYISVFAALGALLRFAMNQWMVGLIFPLSTLIVNAVGSLVIGLAYAAQQKGSLWISEPFHMGLMVGLLGALTTFSGFSLDCFKLLESGRFGLLISNILLQLVVCFSFCVLAYKWGLARIG